MAGAKKPKKPAGSPIWPHPNGQWAKKRCGVPYYFGPWRAHDAALEQYHHDWPYIVKGQVPPPMDADGAVTVGYLCNAYLHDRRGHVEQGKIQSRTWQEYKRIADCVTRTLGKHHPVKALGPADFTRLHAAASKEWGGTRITNFVNYTKMMFRRGVDALELIDHVPNFGHEFKGLSQAERRAIKHKAGPLMFEPDQARRLIESCGPQMRAMVLLGLNGGFNNIDCARLPITAIDFDKSVIDFPREKKHTLRRVTLWSETATALREVIENPNRPTAKLAEDAGLVFLTRCGNPWVKHGERTSKEGKVTERRDDSLAQHFGQVVRNCGCHRKGIGFTALRKTFRTFADEAGDPPAINRIMGHENSTIGDWYVQKIEDERLKKVTDHVRERLEIGQLNLDNSESSAAESSAVAGEQAASSNQQGGKSAAA